MSLLGVALTAWADNPLQPCSATPVAVGNDQIAFRAVRTDYPQAGRSTWYYAVNSGKKPSISHVDFALTCGSIQILDAGTWNGSDLDARTSGGGKPEPGTWPASPTQDPTTGVLGLKFDEGFEDNEIRYYYFTVSGNPPVTSITVATKGGNSFDTALICGPSEDCEPSCDEAQAQMSQECVDGSATLLRFVGVNFPSGSYRVRLYPSTIVGSASNGEILSLTGEFNQFYYVEDGGGVCDAQVGPFIPTVADCGDQSSCPTGGIFDLVQLGVVGPHLMAGDPPNGLFNALIGGAFTSDGSGDSEGRLAVGGNFTTPASSSGYTVGGGAPSSTGGPNAPLSWDNLIVVGTLTGKVGVRGNTVYRDGSPTIYPVGHSNPGLIRSGLEVETEVLDLTAAFASFQALSTELGSCGGGTAGEVTDDGWTVTLDGLNASGLVRFELEALLPNRSFNFVNVANASTILVNVRGTSAALKGGSIALEGSIVNYPIAGASLDLVTRTLWNFPETTQFTLESYLMVGSVLAPYTTSVSLKGGGINGQTVFGGDVAQGGGFEFHNFCFLGSFDACNTASISGTVYNDDPDLGDRNKNTPIPEVTIELHMDADCDGQPDNPDEPWRTTVTSNPSGYYEFSNVPVGQCYVIVERDPADYLSSDDVYGEKEDNIIALEIDAPRHYPDNDYWDHPMLIPPDEIFDYGDLDDTTSGTGTGDYQTLFANDGARHRMTSLDPSTTLRLGVLIDGEGDGQPNATATGDDAASAADEDGVVIPPLTIGEPDIVRVSVLNAPTAGANLFAFFDWNSDGDFDDDGETLAPLTVVNGSNELHLTVPSGLTPTVRLAARFRLSTTATLSWTGLAPDGEVEDYLVTLQSPPTAARLSFFRATLQAAGEVRVEWGTLVEERILGFYVEREQSPGSWQRVGAGLQPAEGYDLRPHSYVLVDADATAERSLRYRLVEVESDGQQNVLAVASVVPPVQSQMSFQDGTARIQMRGAPASEIVVESATVVHGPWSEVARVVLDENGLGQLAFEASTSEPIRFFRILPR